MADLEEIGDLEGYIRRTTTVLVYCSNGYFNSKNCMRELVATVQMGKPIIALIDTDTSRGGLTLEQVQQRLHCPHYARWGFADDTPNGDLLIEALFAHEPIEWNRIGAPPRATPTSMSHLPARTLFTHLWPHISLSLV